MMIEGQRTLRILKYLIVALLAFAVLYPILLCLVNSLKTDKEMYTNFLGLPRQYRWENYVEAWSKGFTIYYRNTFIVTILSVAVSIVGSLLLAYVLTRKRFKLNPIIYTLVIVGMTIPPQISATPLYLLVKDLRLMNRYAGLILTFVAYRLPFTTFIIYGCFKGIPAQIEEAANIDGCGEGQLLTRIFIPLSKPIITAAMIFSLVYVWNNYFFPLMLTTTNEMKMIANGLVQFQGQYRSSYTLMFAGSVVAFLPLLIVYFIAQKQFIMGMTSGAIKG